MERVSQEVAFAHSATVFVDAADIAQLKAWADESPTGRMRLCAHLSEGDAVQEMLIVHKQDTYVVPHKHLGRSESFHIIEGRADVLVFDDDGSITEVVSMGDYTSGLAFYYRVSGPAFHTVRIRSEYLVFHESGQGPFDRSSTQFAVWAPAMDAEAGRLAYMERLDGMITTFMAGQKT